MTLDIASAVLFIRALTARKVHISELNPFVQPRHSRDHLTGLTAKEESRH